jgi:hypothetical protein
VRAPRDGPLAGLAPTVPQARWAVLQRPRALFSCPGLPGLPLPSLLADSITDFFLIFNFLKINFLFFYFF